MAAATHPSTFVPSRVSFLVAEGGRAVLDSGVGCRGSFATVCAGNGWVSCLARLVDGSDGGSLRLWRELQVQLAEFVADHPDSPTPAHAIKFLDELNLLLSREVSFVSFVPPHPAEGAVSHSGL